MEDVKKEKLPKFSIYNFYINLSLNNLETKYKEFEILLKNSLVITLENFTAKVVCKFKFLYDEENSLIHFSESNVNPKQTLSKSPYTCKEFLILVKKIASNLFITSKIILPKEENSALILTIDTIYKIDYIKIIEDLEKVNFLVILSSEQILTTSGKAFIIKGENIDSLIEVDCLGTNFCSNITLMVENEWIKTFK